MFPISRSTHPRYFIWPQKWKPQNFPYIWTKAGDALSWICCRIMDTEWEGGGVSATCTQKTSGPRSRCATLTIWRSVSADGSLCGKGLPRQQHGSGVLTDQAVKPQRGQSEYVRKVGWYLKLIQRNNVWKFGCHLSLAVGWLTSVGHPCRLKRLTESKGVFLSFIYIVFSFMLTDFISPLSLLLSEVTATGGQKGHTFKN